MCHILAASTFFPTLLLLSRLFTFTHFPHVWFFHVSPLWFHWWFDDPSIQVASWKWVLPLRLCHYKTGSQGSLSRSCGFWFVRFFALLINTSMRTHIPASTVSVNAAAFSPCSSTTASGFAHTDTVGARIASPVSVSTSSLVRIHAGDEWKMACLWIG